MTALAEAATEQAEPSTHPGDPGAAIRLRGEVLTFELDNHGRPLTWNKLQSLHMLTIDGRRCQLFRSGSEVAGDAAVHTGDRIAVHSSGDDSVYTVALKADLLGTGRVDVSQLVRMAAALQGTAPLTDTGGYFFHECYVLLI